MVDLSLPEAQLYKMLVNFFGAERIVPRMSVLAACGGELPTDANRINVPKGYHQLAGDPEKMAQWARKNRCLFTIVDDDDNPKLVVDFEAIEEDTIDAQRLEYQRIVEPILRAAGVRFFTITSDEFREMLKPAGNLDLFHFFRERFEELGFSIISK